MYGSETQNVVHCITGALVCPKTLSWIRIDFSSDEVFNESKSDKIWRTVVTISKIKKEKEWTYFVKIYYNYRVKW